MFHKRPAPSRKTLPAMFRQQHDIKTIIIISLTTLLTSCSSADKKANDMGLLDSLFNKSDKNVDWDKFRTTDSIYPQNSISVFTVDNGNGIATGWVDKSYSNYSYKKYCPFNLHITVDLTDKIAESNLDLDMGTIEDFFIDELKKICVSHMVSRVATDTGMEIEMYIEKPDPIKEFLSKSNADPKRLFSFTYSIADDPKWDNIKQLMKIK